MMTQEQAQRSIGQKAIYRSHPQNPPEEGVITSANARGIFVRYGADVGPKLTRFEDLTLVTLEVAAAPEEKR